jgi:hypothetical protein
VEIWNLKYDWLRLASNNKIKILMWDARMKQWVWEKSEGTEIFKIYLCTLCKNLISWMWMVNGCIW